LPSSCSFITALAAAPALADKKSPTGLHVVPNPFINNSSLSATAALSSTDMWAVGDIATGSSTTQTLAEHFDGIGWSVVSTPALNASLSAVGGAAGNDVWAVGQQASGSSTNTLIEHWNGSSWSVVSSPKVPDGSFLTRVAAPASNNVWAVGLASGSNDALVEHWDGSSWSVVSSPAFVGDGGTRDISADSSSDAWAVGGTTSLHWNGLAWSQVPTAHLRFGGVVAVTALSPTNVWAVGVGPGVPTGGFSAHPTAVIEHWDGTSWTVVPSPNPNPQINNSLYDVAAVDANDVWAIGLAGGPFTEHWNGASWTILSTPYGLSSLGGLSTLSTGTVIAAGTENNSGVILSN
jgi:hypothetical protein